VGTEAISQAMETSLCFKSNPNDFLGTPWSNKKPSSEKLMPHPMEGKPVSLP